MKRPVILDNPIAMRLPAQGRQDTDLLWRIRGVVDEDDLDQRIGEALQGFQTG